MKKLSYLIVVFLGMATNLFSQPSMSTPKSSLPEIAIAPDISLHFLSPEPISYVDISSRAIAGDLPVKNILRVKLVPDSLAHLMHVDPAAVITIVGESFIAQYRLRVVAACQVRGISTQVDIAPSQMRPLDIIGISMTSPEMKATALAMLTDHRSRPVRKVQAYGIRAKLNHLYAVGDLLFLDLNFTNQTKLAFDTDQLRFKIEDSRITKATNAQSIEIKPLWQLYPETAFKRNQRNIYVLKKVTFPENKVLNIELAEKPISGRALTLKVSYKDVLHADTF